MDNEGRSLCLGETVILQDEINPFISRLRENGIIVTALHNHWLFNESKLMYIHFDSIEKPLSFSRKVRSAFEVLNSGNVGSFFKCKRTYKQKGRRTLRRIPQNTGCYSHM